MSDKPLVIYHGACRDGFCAAWCVWRRMPGAEFVPAMYGNPPPDVDGRDVIVVDFSYDRALMDEMERRAKSLLVLDHHKTAEAALADAPYAQFDMERSGAGMAWDHFFPGSPRPWIVDYVEDRDLWRHRLPEGPAVNAFLGTLRYDFEHWYQTSRRDLNEIVPLGQVVEDKIRHYVTEVAKNACRATFHGHDVPIVNAPQVDISELVGFLCNGEKFAMGWWQRSDGKFSISLRSRGDFDVSELAKMHGGGGHKNAAGFLTDHMPLTGSPWRKACEDRDAARASHREAVTENAELRRLITVALGRLEENDRKMIDVDIATDALRRALRSPTPTGETP